MKKNRSVDNTSGPAKPSSGTTLSEEEASQPPNESLNLSPERIMDGASTTTILLSQILAQREEPHRYRHWGINE